MSSARDNTVYKYGLRGKRLASLREKKGIGQRHLARDLGISQPELSFMEGERFGGIPRGFSSRYQNAVAAIVSGESEHWTGQGRQKPGCGCKVGR